MLLISWFMTISTTEYRERQHVKQVSASACRLRVVSVSAHLPLPSRAQAALQCTCEFYTRTCSNNLTLRKRARQLERASQRKRAKRASQRERAKRESQRKQASECEYCVCGFLCSAFKDVCPWMCCLLNLFGML